MNFMKIVEKICSIESTDCRSLNKSELARKLMDMVNIPQNAKIQEIPLDWNDQVEILFTIPEDKYYYGLNAGHVHMMILLNLQIIQKEAKELGHFILEIRMS